MVRESINRSLDLGALLRKKSHFLFGPRGTGKSWLVRQQLSRSVDYIDLLHSATYLHLTARPSDLEAMISKETVVIDEVQRIPELLNEVHRLIENRRTKFLLTGSSARRLKRGGANLLAGRAYTAALFPLNWAELEGEGRFDLNRFLRFGGLPSAITEDDPEAYLAAYVDTYLKEEIQAEALVRNLGNFARFLQVAALANTQIVNYTKVANDSQLSPNTVRDYFQILEDTLIGYQLPAWTRSRKRKAIQAAKFYFFDIGVAHAINSITDLEEHSDTYGKAFEHFMAMELRAYLSYSRVREALQYWRSTTKFEVDFLVGNRFAVEVKSTRRASERDQKGLQALAEEDYPGELFLVSRDEQTMSFPSGIRHLHWREFLRKLWNGDLLNH